MGDVLTSVFGGGQNTSQEVTPDAQAQALNKLRYDQLSNLFGTYGYGSLAGENPYGAYAPTSTSQRLSDTVETVLAGYNPKAGSESVVRDTSSALTPQEYINLGLQKGQDYLTQIASPEILSSLVIAGLEKSGAVPEALAKASAQISLPFLQSLPAAVNTLELAPLQRNQLATNINLSGLQGNLLNNQSLGAGFQSLGAGLPVGDYSNVLKREDINRRQGIFNTGLTGLPFTPGQKAEGGTNQQPLHNFFGQG